MPICPNCGETFQKGGAYDMHVKHCDADPSEAADEEELERQVGHLEARIDRLEDAALEAASRSLYRETDGRSRDAARKADKAAKRSREAEDLAEDLKEALGVNCRACGALIKMPWKEPERCPGCETRLAWDAVEVGTVD